LGHFKNKNNIYIERATKYIRHVEKTNSFNFIYNDL